MAKTELKERQYLILVSVSIADWWMALDSNFAQCIWVFKFCYTYLAKGKTVPLFSSQV